MKIAVKICLTYIKSALIWLLQTIRPILGNQGCCCFTISCSQFAIIQLQKKSFFHAIWEIFCRLMRCNFIYMKFIHPQKKSNLD